MVVSEPSVAITEVGTKITEALTSIKLKIILIKFFMIFPHKNLLLTTIISHFDKKCKMCYNQGNENIEVEATHRGYHCARGGGGVADFESGEL